MINKIFSVSNLQSSFTKFHSTKAETYGHEQINVLSPFALFTLATDGQNFPLLFTHSNGYAACYLVNLCGQLVLPIYAAV